MARAPFEKIGILLKIETCKDCPYVEVHRTLGVGFAHDYHCTHPQIKDCSDDPNRPGKKVMGFVEWSTDEKPVPEWCPVRHDACDEKIQWLESQLLSDVTTSDWAQKHIQEIDILREIIHGHEEQLANLRNKYGKLHTYWQLVSLEGEYKFASYSFEELKEANKEFVKLLKLDGNKGCDRACGVCTTQCSQRSFLLPREPKKEETDGDV